MGAMSKELAAPQETPRTPWYCNPRVQGAICLAATIASTQGLPKVLSRSPLVGFVCQLLQCALLRSLLIVALICMHCALVVHR
jgi:hypothetical protein